MRRQQLMMIIGGFALVLTVLVLISMHGPGKTSNLAITGQLADYEAPTRELTLRTDNGDRHFFVPADTPVHDGAQTVTLAALRSAKGCPAKVWCRYEDGRCAVYEIRVSCN
jgi:hypothetical protein